MCDVGVDNPGSSVLKKEERAFLSFGKTFSTPDPASFSEERLSAAEKAAQQVLDSIHPTLDSEERRRDVIDHLQRLLKTNLNCEVFPYGSVPLKTYLPDGDIDLTVLKGSNAEELLARDVLAILRGEEHNEHAEYHINDTQFIDAEVKIVKCLVQNIVVDISFNQIGGLSTLCFLEQVDRLVGKNHLFKRSILLIKTWCFYESRILGATHGLLSTYALETLILYIFQLFHGSLSGPLAALYRFLDYFSQFDWENYCISLKGPVCKLSLPNVVVKLPNSVSNDLLLGEEFMESCMEMFQVPCRWLQSNQKAFQLKHINIIDPLKENNNLGRSVHRGNFFRIRSAFKFGARRLGNVLSQPGDQVADEINKFFSNILSRYKKQSSGAVEHLGLEIGDDASSTASLSSHFELFPDDDLLLKSSIGDFDDDDAGMGEKSIFLFENEPDRCCLAGDNYSDMASEACYLADGVVISGHCITENAYDSWMTNSNSKTSRPNYLSNRKYVSGNLCNKLNCPSSKPSAKNVNLENGDVHDKNEHSGTNNADDCCMDNSEAVGRIGSGSYHTKASVLENISDDFRGTDAGSVGGGESEALDPLIDLSGDYDSHIRSFLYGPLSHGFPSSPFTPSHHPATPSSIQNTSMQYDTVPQNNMQYDTVPQNNMQYDTVPQNNMQHDSVHQSIPFNPNHINMNSYSVSMGQIIYSVADSAWPIDGFHYEGKSSVRGTGTYFPPATMNGFYRERPTQGRGRRKAPGNRNQIHRHHRSNNLYPALNRSNSFENGTREVLPENNKFQGQWKPGGRSQAGDGNQTNSYSSSSCRIEFGTVGNLAEEVMASSKHVRGSNQCGLTGNTGFNCNKAKEVCKAVDAP